MSKLYEIDFGNEDKQKKIQEIICIMLKPLVEKWGTKISKDIFQEYSLCLKEGKNGRQIKNQIEKQLHNMSEEEVFLAGPDVYIEDIESYVEHQALLILLIGNEKATKENIKQMIGILSQMTNDIDNFLYEKGKEQIDFECLKEILDVMLQEKINDLVEEYLQLIIETFGEETEVKKLIKEFYVMVNKVLIKY